MGERKRWLGNGEETQQAELHFWVLLTGGVQRVRNKSETQIQIQTPLNVFPLAVSQNLHSQ